jgi:hypothetical protein
VSKSMKVFIIGVSLMLILMVVLGCLPGLKVTNPFNCQPLISRIQSMLPFANKAAGTVQAPPQDIKIEEAKMDKVIGAVCTAFKVKDVEGALKYFAEDERDTYRKALSQSPGTLPSMAADLEKAKINSLTYNSEEYGRTAEYLIKNGAQTASIILINKDGQWLIKAF